MKQIFLLGAMLTTLFVNAQDDYVIDFGGQRMDISLGKTYEYQLGNSAIPFTVRLKDTLVYDGGLYSFRYPKDYKVTSHDLKDGLIEQAMIMTATGTGFSFKSIQQLIQVR